MRSLLLGIVCLVATSSYACSATASDTCASPAACAEALIERHITDSQELELIRNRVAEMEPQAVAEAFADRFANIPQRLRGTDRWNIATLPDKTRHVLIFNLLRRNTDAAALQAGQIIRWHDAPDIVSQLATLPDKDIDPIKRRISRLSFQRQKTGPAGLSLLMEEPARSDALAHQLSMPYSFDAALALRYLSHINPNRADRVIFPILSKAENPRKLLNHLSGSGFLRDTNFEWLGTVWTDTRLPESVRTAALNLSLRATNPSPVPWTPELEEALSADTAPFFRWADVLALYRNDALGIFEREYEKNAPYRARLLYGAASVNGLDSKRLMPLVRHGLNVRDDYDLTIAALQAWDAYELNALDAKARATIDESPFDFVRAAIKSDSPVRPHVNISNLSKLRTHGDYCERGVPLTTMDMAREQARAVGVPEQPAKPYDIDLRAVSTAIRFGGDWYIGYDRGEFGGGLIRYGQDHTKETVLGGNVQFIASIDETPESNGFWIMSGLNHMLPRGALYKLDRTGLQRVMKLPSAVTRLGIDGDTYILSFHSADRDPDHWLHYHPPLELHSDGRMEPGCK